MNFAPTAHSSIILNFQHIQLIPPIPPPPRPHTRMPLLRRPSPPRHRIPNNAFARKKIDARNRNAISALNLSQSSDFVTAVPVQDAAAGVIVLLCFQHHSPPDFKKEEGEGKGDKKTYSSQQSKRHQSSNTQPKIHRPMQEAACKRQ